MQSDTPQDMIHIKIDDASFYLSRINANKSSYLSSLISRWTKDETKAIYLDMNIESFSIIIDFLRYGCTNKRIDKSTSKMIKIDAEYLGIDCVDYNNMRSPSRITIDDEPMPIDFDYACKKCCKKDSSSSTCITKWRCCDCQTTVNKENTRRFYRSYWNSNLNFDLRYHYCEICKKVVYCTKYSQCLKCFSIY